ncbi:uncharacterized protein LOC123503183 [Portunus trituberculatus]|uniref:uncharacterized protein LOC123503183 n=1 Tax=Portunus trituberculatus TaxID=210409 RepID=UPI001E1CDCC4|nr:uncharacterized protein LOC123503183 [Portunus trituberculatus]
MSGVTLEDLWCQCDGNASATPHRVLMHRQMTKLHAAAQRHAIWYVAVVLALYVFGLVIIIRRSGRTERHTAASALSFCFSRAASTVASRRKKRRNRGDRPRASPPSDPRQQVIPSLQVHLVVPDDDDEMEISMVTTVA